MPISYSGKAAIHQVFRKRKADRFSRGAGGMLWFGETLLL
jgi:hypothetical protein